MYSLLTMGIGSFGKCPWSDIVRHSNSKLFKVQYNAKQIEVLALSNMNGK